MKCLYCKQAFYSETCPNCGSGKFEETVSSGYDRAFLHNGYIVWGEWVAWGEEILWRDLYRWHFYLGDKLVETIEMTREVYREIKNRFLSEGEDMFPFVWELFKLAQGEKEVVRIQEQNKRVPAMFEVTRVETNREKQLKNMSMADILRETRK